MSSPTSYDPNHPNELGAPALPAAPQVRISDRAILQPPLSKRGEGPGLILIQHSLEELTSAVGAAESRALDPEPIQKWAEEGFAVAAITLPRGTEQREYNSEITAAAAALRAHNSVTNKTILGSLLYTDDSSALVPALLPALQRCGVACLVGYGSVSKPATDCELPLYIHMAKVAGDITPATVSTVSNVTVAQYDSVRDFFIDPRVSNYNAAASSVAHTRSLVFLRKHLGGPHFDLEAIWEEHTYWEFEKRSVSQTMATMVVSGEKPFTYLEST